MMRTLLVVPHSDLPNVDAEIQAIIRSGLDVTPLLSNVTHETLRREISENRYDVLWFCAHGTEQGVMLDDGLLDMGLLTSLVRYQFGLVVLNTCSSHRVAQMIQNETDAFVVATLSDVPDRTAYAVGSEFAKALAETQSVGIAYRRARPGGNTQYVLLGSNQGGSFMRIEGVEPLTQELRELSTEMKRLTREIYELRSEMAVLKLRQEHIERAQGAPPSNPLTGFWHSPAFHFVLMAISVFVGIWLYAAANLGG